MNEKSIKRTAHFREGDVPAGRTDWARVRAMSDEEIDAGALSDPDNPPLTAEEFAAGDVVLPSDRRKVLISTRMDSAALEKFKELGPRYQTRLNDLMVAASEGRVLILDGGARAAYASVKNRDAVMNAILRHHAPAQGPAPEWSVKVVPAGVQRVRTAAKPEWGGESDGVRIQVERQRASGHAS